MAIKVLDELKTPLGLSLAGLYYSLRGRCEVNKDRATSCAEVRFLNDNSTPCLYSASVSCAYAQGEDPFAKLYLALKEKFSSSEDC